MRNDTSNPMPRVGAVLALALLTCASLLSPLGGAAVGSETLVVSGTLTQTRASPACQHSAPAQAVATFVGATLVSLDAVTTDGAVVTGAGTDGVFQTSVGWCTATLGAGVLSATRDCPGEALAFTLAGPASTLTFVPASGACVGDDLLSVATERSNPQPVTLASADPFGTRLGCVGSVRVTFWTGGFSTFVGFAEDCTEAQLCAPYLALPGVIACSYRTFPVPMTPVNALSTAPQDVGCLWQTTTRVDTNGDGTPEATLPGIALDTVPCPP